MRSSTRRPSAGLPHWNGAYWKDWHAFALALLLLTLCLLGGGASRDDVLSLLYVQPAAAIVLALACLSFRREHYRRVRVPLILLALFAALHVVQLVPLPPAIWTSLGGRDAIVATAPLIGALPWRPISIAPDLTLASLTGLVPVAAILVAAAQLDMRQHYHLLLFLVGGVALSVLLAALQLTGGTDNPYHLYRVTNDGTAVGLFANRNHQAAFLAIGMPLLAVALNSLAGRARRSALLVGLLVLGCLLLSVMILVTGSRAGLVLGALGLLGAALLFQGQGGNRIGQRPSYYAWIGIAALVVAASAALVLLSPERALTLTRLSDNVLVNESRVANLGLYAELMRENLLTGAGLGAFDPLFRIHEPLSALKPSYLNHAHNDLAELVMTGGILAGALLFALLTWTVRKALPLVRGELNPLGMLGAAITLMLLIASLFDYPLRTPFLGCVFALGIVWLSVGNQADTVRRNTPAPGGSR